MDTFHILNGNGIHNAIYLYQIQFHLLDAVLLMLILFYAFFFLFMSHRSLLCVFVCVEKGYVLAVRTEDKREGIQLDKEVMSQGKSAEQKLDKQRVVHEAYMRVCVIQIYVLPYKECVHNIYFQI